MTTFREYHLKASDWDKEAYTVIWRELVLPNRRIKGLFLDRAGRLGITLSFEGEADTEIYALLQRACEIHDQVGSLQLSEDCAG